MNSFDLHHNAVGLNMIYTFILERTVYGEFQKLCFMEICIIASVQNIEKIKML